ncbi:MAG: hypothetical protein SGBAC_009842 [Bacillariaceae sp.]
MAQASAATAPGAYNGDYPLKDIPAPHPHDVLCGRGGGTNNHIGNSHWRMLVAANKQLYITLPKRQKMLLSRSIVNAVRSQNPPGRFLQKDSKSNKWFDVGDQRAQEKTSQALREGAPDIRKKVAAEKDPDTATPEKTPNAPGPEPTPANDTQKTTTNDNSESKNSSVANGVASHPNVAPPAAAPAPAVSPAHAMPAQQQPHQHQHQQQPMMAQQQAYMMNGGMPMHPYQQMQHQMQQQHGYPMMHPYQQMQQGMPMQGYPPMVMNEQGMMVPAYPGMHPQLMQQQMHMQQQMPHPQAAQMQQQHMQQQMPPGTMPTPQSAVDSEPIPYAPSTSQHHEQQQQEQQQSQQSAQPSLPQSQASNPNVPNFDEFVSVAPPDGGLEPAGLSYGSVMMTENEMRKLESGGTSFGTAMSYKKDPMPGPVGSGILENAPGASFGDVSMMSVSTRKLEDGGFSFGSAMSFGTNMVDGGLEAIGASFGSLSLDTRNRETLFHQLELAAAGPEIPPMLNTTKSTANLLDCSDSEEELEDESQKHEMARKKSQAWERMQHSVANNLSSQKSNTGRSETSKEVMPPPVPRDQTGTDISVPSTTLFSQLSAFDDGDFVKQVHHDDDALPPPPAPLQKNDDDDEKLDMYLIHQQSGS